MTDIRPLKFPAEISRGVLFYLLLVLLIAVLVVGFFYFLKKKKRQISTAENIFPQLSPEEIVHQELSELNALSLIEKGELKKYYFRLSEIMRRYIQGCFEFAALDCTTEEILKELKRKKLKYNKINLIRGFLTQCDMVKFAKYKPSIDEIKEDLKKVREIIQASSYK